MAEKKVTTCRQSNKAVPAAMMASERQQEPPEGFELTPNAVSEETWMKLKEWLDTDKLNGKHCPIPFEIGAQNRRVAQFGFRYDYINDVVDTTTPTPPIPSELYDLLNVPRNYSQCIINTYDPDILIPFHKDDLQFGPTILVFTFGEARPLLLRDIEDNNRQYIAIPTHCSKYTLSKEARFQWEHMIPAGKAYRVSFTFRTHCNDGNGLF